MRDYSYLQIYTSGGVVPPLKRVAEDFQGKYGIKINLTVGKIEKLISTIKLNKKGDVLSCGAEHSLDDAERLGIIDRESRRSAGLRRSVLLVERGNPKRINSIEDLTKEGIKIGVSTEGCLVGIWDDICSKAGLTNQIRRNIIEFADGCGAVMGLLNQKKVDVIFGWNAFNKIWPGTSEIVELPKELQVYRSTGLAMVSYSKNPNHAIEFIQYVTSRIGKDIYTKLGWIHNI